MKTTLSNCRIHLAGSLCTMLHKHGALFPLRLEYYRYFEHEITDSMWNYFEIFSKIRSDWNSPSEFSIIYKSATGNTRRTNFTFHFKYPFTSHDYRKKKVDNFFLAFSAPTLLEQKCYGFPFEKIIRFKYRLYRVRLATARIAFTLLRYRYRAPLSHRATSFYRRALRH